MATRFLVEALLQRDGTDDVPEADAAIERLASAGRDDLAVVSVVVLRLRALLARARGDDVTFRVSLSRCHAESDGPRLRGARRDGSVQIAFDFAFGSHTGLIRVLTGLAQGAALAQQIPALVELNFEAAQSAVLLGLVDLAVLQLGAQFLLLGHKFVDLGENVGIFVRVRSHAPSLPDYRGERGN